MLVKFGTTQWWIYAVLANEFDMTEDITSVLEANRVNGETFLSLTEADLKELYPLLGQRKAVQRIVGNFTPRPSVVTLDVTKCACQ